MPLIKAYGLELVVPHCARLLSVTSAPWAPTARAPTVSVYVPWQVLQTPIVEVFMDEPPLKADAPEACWLEVVA